MTRVTDENGILYADSCTQETNKSVLCQDIYTCIIQLCLYRNCFPGFIILKQNIHVLERVARNTQFVLFEEEGRMYNNGIKC